MERIIVELGDVFDMIDEIPAGRTYDDSIRALRAIIERANKLAAIEATDMFENRRNGVHDPRDR